jgi:glycosyltransferase involved in cell wall biosynthesis
VDLKQIRADSIAQFSVPLPVACEGKPLLLHVGRLDPQKRHKLLFEACAWLVEHEQNFHLLCIGDGQLRGELEKFVDNLGLNKFVSFLGFIKNPFPFMRRARALVLPSESESFALVLVEALACGCVPVAFDCPHGPRDVLDGGRAGFLVREETPQALAQAIYQALNDDFLVTEKLRYGESWIEQYSLTQMVPKWENLLARVAISRNLSN